MYFFGVIILLLAIDLAFSLDTFSISSSFISLYSSLSIVYFISLKLFLAKAPRLSNKLMFSELLNSMWIFYAKFNLLSCAVFASNLGTNSSISKFSYPTYFLSGRGLSYKLAKINSDILFYKTPFSLKDLKWPILLERTLHLFKVSSLDLPLEINFLTHLHLSHSFHLNFVILS